MQVSKKELILNEMILKRLENKPLELVNLLFADEEIHYLQEYSNTVSIKRLKFNDHGPVHMRTVTLNSIIMANLLHESGIAFNLEKEDIGTFEDSLVAIILASFLHDIGMSIGRENHENNGVLLAMPIIDRILAKLYKDDLEKRVIIRSVALEGIFGHMATHKIHSLEAGLILIADGCDMEKGRARIPMLITTESHVGDIHKYSAAAIEKVIITKGDKKPIKILAEMSSFVGIFQIEEVLFRKISSSPVKNYIELYAKVIGGEVKCYL